MQKLIQSLNTSDRISEGSQGNRKYSIYTAIIIWQN